MRSKRQGKPKARPDAAAESAELPPMPDVLAEPFWDPEPYWTRETRAARRCALEAEARRMGTEGFPAGCFSEAIACLDEAAIAEERAARA